MFKSERKPYQGFNFKGRLRALGVHLLASSVIFSLFMFVMLTYWYPMPHFEINAGWQGVRIMLLVDMVIGPLLTFFLYNNRKSKKELRFDLGLIVIIQAALLVYGIQTVYSQRPIVQVLSHRGYIATPRRTDMIAQADVNIDQVVNALNVEHIHPPLVFSIYENYFKEAEEKKKNLFKNKFSQKIDESIKGDLNPEMIVSRYRAITSVEAWAGLPEAQKRSFERIKRDPNMQAELEKYQQKHGDNFYFFPLFGAYGNAVMVLEKHHLKPVDYFAVSLYGEGEM